MTGGTVKCWGSNSSGELGDGSIADSTAPVFVSGLANVAKVASGNSRTCALLADAAVQCWGTKYYGLLGDGSDAGSPTPVAVLFTEPLPVPVVTTTVPISTTVPVTTTTVSSSVPSVPISKVIGKSIAIRKMPPIAVAKSVEIGVSKTKVMVLLMVPKATKPINQVTKYILQLKPKKGLTITKTITVKPRATVKPTLTGKKKVSYALTVTSVTKGGKKTVWKGPNVRTS